MGLDASPYFWALSNLNPWTDFHLFYCNVLKFTPVHRPCSLLPPKSLLHTRLNSFTDSRPSFSYRGAVSLSTAHVVASRPIDIASTQKHKHIRLGWSVRQARWVGPSSSIARPTYLLLEFSKYILCVLKVPLPLLFFY